MGKNISDNQGVGYIGENEFRLWASKIGWFPTKLDPDHGLDFVCQLRGERTTDKSYAMPGKLLSVSVRSTEANGDAITITRDDAELLLTTNTPMVFAIVKRGHQDESGKVAIKFPDETFIKELDAFWRSGADHHQLRFSDAVTDIGKIRYNAERLFKEDYTDRLFRLRAKLRLEGLVPDAAVETVHTKHGVRGFIRSNQFSAPLRIEQHPELADALQGLGVEFLTLLPTQWPMHPDVQTQVTTLQHMDRNVADIAVPQTTHLNGSGPSHPVHSTFVQIANELAAWNYHRGADLAHLAEQNLRAGEPIDRPIILSNLTLIVRARLNQLETCSLRHDLEGVSLLLERAEKLVTTGDTDRLAEIVALKASLENLQTGPDAALALLTGRTDPYAIRTRTALLLNQKRFTEAMAVVEGLKPHEWWCDVATAVYALNDQVGKAKTIVQWAAGLADQSRYPQCIVRMGKALLSRSFVDHPDGRGLFPATVTSRERDRLATVLETIHPLLLRIQTAGKPTSGLDMATLEVAWQANHFLQNRTVATELLTLMSTWTPIHMDVAKGVSVGYIEGSSDLADRFRRDHPDDFDAGMAATIIQVHFLGQYKEALPKAKELVVLADNDDKKEELFKVFQLIWQNVEGTDRTECETISSALVTHNPVLRAVFEGSITLRNGDPDRTLTILDAQKAEDNPYWMQLRANAFLGKRQFREALDSLLPIAKQTQEPHLLQKAADIAFKVERYDVAVSLYERLTQLRPRNLSVHGSLAYIYTFLLHDLEKAAEQFRVLHAAQPTNPTHTFNLAICLVQLFRPDESLPLYDELCQQEDPPVPAILARAQLHHSLGRPDSALVSLEPFRARFWNEPSFLTAYITTAHAAGNDAAAHEALMALNQLREEGVVKPDALRIVREDEGLEILKQSFKQTQDRDLHLHEEMLRGRMPWVWAEQVSRNAVYWGWRTRTQDLAWIGDEPTNRARFCIYSTNGFTPRKSSTGRLSLLSLGCPLPGTKIVADISALLTLDRLGLLDAAAEYFREVLVPAGYLPTVLEDSRQMVLGQRSQRDSAERIVKQVNAGHIFVLEDEATMSATMPVVDEYADSTEHRYRLADLVTPVHQAGVLPDQDSTRISVSCTKPSGVDDKHPPLRQFQEVIVDLTTLETLARSGVLNDIATFYNIRIPAQVHKEVLQRLDVMAYQEETRQWHMDLWTRLRNDTRFKFVPHTIPKQMQRDGIDVKDFLPFLASFIAQENKIPLLADDRACQAFTLNAMSDVPNASFGSDVLIQSLMTIGKLDSRKTGNTILQLMKWRYRFIVPSAETLKTWAEAYRTNLPGKSLQTVAEYVHDCMRDPGLFNGSEPVDLGESMAGRLYLEWVSTVADFLVLVWGDETFTTEIANGLTDWTVTELLPSVPRVLDGQLKVRMASFTNRLFLSHALMKTQAFPRTLRMGDAMRSMKEALRLTDDEYTALVTGVLNDTATTTTNS